jgi:Siphovirus Gp157
MTNSLSEQILGRELSIFRTIKERVAMAEELSPDDPFVIGTAEGECSLPEVLAELIREARKDEAKADALKGIINDDKTRLARIERRAKHLRHIAHYGMCEAGLTRLDAPDFSVSRVKGKPPVIIPNPDAVPDSMMRIRKEPNLTAIREALELDPDLGFAILGNGEEHLLVKGR